MKTSVLELEPKLLKHNLQTQVILTPHELSFATAPSADVHIAPPVLPRLLVLVPSRVGVAVLLAVALPQFGPSRVWLMVVRGLGGVV